MNVYMSTPCTFVKRVTVLIPDHASPAEAEGEEVSVSHKKWRLRDQTSTIDVVLLGRQYFVCDSVVK